MIWQNLSSGEPVLETWPTMAYDIIVGHGPTINWIFDYRALYFKTESRDLKKPLLANTKYCANNGASLGDPIMVSGFHESYYGENEDNEEEKLTKLPASFIWSYNIQNRMKHTSKMMDLVIKRGGDAVNRNNTVATSRIPQHSKELCRRPDYAREVRAFTHNTCNTSAEQARLEARKIIEQLKGQTSLKIAKRCFKMGQKFNRMRWSSQMSISLRCCKNYIKKQNK